MSSLLLVLLLCSGAALAGAGDGFNLFKDRLRGKGEEGAPEEPEPIEPVPRVVYFYRTPVARQSGDPYEPHPLAADFGKRIDRYRSLVMQRELAGADAEPGGGLEAAAEELEAVERASGAARAARRKRLSWVPPARRPAALAARTRA
ncbi:hypothetical protein R5R35_011090 [Gryllus longicercus]|uniref:Accessory gland protein n=1 Tax=Gryllus longicercus TaxID=2509291 RepID=A0AAN9VYF8_9ORTH